MNILPEVKDRQKKMIYLIIKSVEIGDKINETIDIIMEI